MGENKDSLYNTPTSESLKLTTLALKGFVEKEKYLEDSIFSKEKNINTYLNGSENIYLQTYLNQFYNETLPKNLP